MAKRIEELYFEWMQEIVCDNKHMAYTKLLHFLMDTPFYYIIDMDGNRYEDGIDLRYRFAEHEGYNETMIAKHIDHRDCTVLEMMIALAIRLEEHIMSDPEKGDRTSVWFWDMIKNLGLTLYDDDNFDVIEVTGIIKRFLNRDYKPDGHGGLFVIPHTKDDLRNVEIWYQANWYLNQI